MLKSLNQVVKQTGDDERWGAILQNGKDNRSNSYITCQTFTFFYQHTLIFQHSATYTCVSTPGLRKITHSPTHAYVQTHTHTHTPTHTHIHTQSRVKYEALVECYWETRQFLPFELAVKCISQIKMASMTHVRSH